MSEVRVQLPVDALSIADCRLQIADRKSEIRKLKSAIEWGVAQRESSRLLSGRLQVRVLPPQLVRKGKPTGDGSRLESGRPERACGFDSHPFRFDSGIG